MQRIDTEFSAESRPTIALSKEEYEKFGNTVMNVAYSYKIRSINRGLLTSCRSGLYKKSLRPYLMLFLTDFITYTCFPSMITYKHLPWKYFTTPDTSEYDQTETVAWMGAINVGSFVIVYGFAILIVG